MFSYGTTPFLLLLFRRTGILLKFAQNRREIPLCDRMLPFPEGVYTSAHRAKHGAFRMGVVSLPSDCFTRFGNPAWPGGRTANFAAFGAWPWVLPKNAESLRDSDALMRVAVPRRRGPAGLRDLFLFLPKLRLLRSAHTGPFRVCEAGVVSPPSARFARCRNAGRPHVKVVYLPFSCVPY